MRDSILDILAEHINMSTNRSEPLADELTAFMCYREVRAYCKGRSVFLTVPNLLVALFKEYYPEQTIREAIEKVKNEQK